MTQLPPHIISMIAKEAENRFDAEDLGDGQSCAHGYRVGATVWASKCVELVECLSDVIHGEPKDSATTYPRAEKLIAKFNNGSGEK